MSGLETRGLYAPQQVLDNRGRLAIFIDGSNLFYAALQLNIEIDYSKLLCYLTAGSRLLRAFFYTGVDPTNEKQQGFLLWMRRNGYRVVPKGVGAVTRWDEKGQFGCGNCGGYALVGWVL